MDDEKTLAQRSPLLLLALCALLLSVAGARPAAAQQQEEATDVTLRGFVTDASSGQALPGANVALLEPLPQDSALRVARGAVADADGLYQLSGVAPGRYVLRVSYVGYRPLVDTLSLGAEAFVQQDAALSPAEGALDEIVVVDEGAGAARLEAGLQRVRPEDLERIPTPGVGGDLAMYLQTLPGVVSLGDRGGQLFIRGGTPDQNLVLIDNTLIYQPFHIVGFFSAFPQELVQGADVYAGGFPARYAGRISSVIDVKMRAGNKKRFAAGAQAGPFLVGARLEGPLTGDGALSAIGSVRQSVIEQTAPTLLGQEQPLTFSDAYLKLDHRGASSSCGLTAMRTRDRGRVDAERDAVFRWTNTTVGGRCLAFAPESAVTADVSLGFSRFYNEVGAAEAPERSSAVWRIHTDVDLVRPAGERLEWRGGFRGRYNKLSYELGERFTGVRLDADALMRVGAYGGAKLTLGGGRLDLEPSVALTVPFDYAPSVEPRLRLAWRPFGSAAEQLSGAVGLYRQTMVGISDERDAGSVFRAWLPAPLGGRRARALHAILGWQQRFGEARGLTGILGLDALDVSLEGYYKELANLPVPIWSNIARFTTELGLAGGEVYGFDARAEVEEGRFYGSLGYGFSWTRYDFEQALFGRVFGEPVQAYHPPHDRRHTLNAVTSLELGEWTASARWQLGSGLPYTRPYGFDSQVVLDGLPDVRTTFGTPRVLFDKPYRGRLPAYHRLDVSVGRTFSLGGAELTAEGGAINVYDRRNLFYYDVFTLSRVDQLPLVPYLSVKVATP